jgi:hypothetical protein
MIDDPTTDDFDKYVTPATPKPQREFRTDRNNNPIAAAVTTGGRNQFTDALDQAEIPWEHGDQFPGNPKLSTIKIKGDPIEGARAILSNSNALKWYRNTTGKTILPKYGVRSSADFTKLSTDRQNEIINGIYQSEGGNGKLKPAQDDFDKYVSSETQQQAAQPEDDFEKYVAQQPLSGVTAGVSGSTETAGRGVGMARASRQLPVRRFGGGVVKPMVAKGTGPLDVTAGVGGEQGLGVQPSSARSLMSGPQLTVNPTVARAAQRPTIASRIRANTVDNAVAADPVRQAVKAAAPPGFGLLPESVQEFIGSVIAQGAGDLIGQAAGIVRSIPNVPLSVAKVPADKLNQIANEIHAGQSAMDRQSGRSALSQTAKDVLGGGIGSAPALAMVSLGVPPAVAFGLQSYLSAQGRDADLTDILKETAKGATIGALFELPLPSKLAMSGEIGRRLAKAGLVGTGTKAVDLATGGDPKDITNPIVNALFAASGGADRAEAPEVGSSKPASIAPVIADARAERVAAATQDAQPLEMTDPKLARTALGTAAVQRGGDETLNQRGRSGDVSPAIQMGAPTVTGIEPPQEQVTVARTGSVVRSNSPSSTRAAEGMAQPELVRHVDLQKRDEAGKFDEETPRQANARRAKVEQASQPAQAEISASPEAATQPAERPLTEGGKSTPSPASEPFGKLPTRTVVTALDERRAELDRQDTENAQGRSQKIAEWAKIQTPVFEGQRDTQLPAAQGGGTKKVGGEWRLYNPSGNGSYIALDKAEYSALKSAPPASQQPVAAGQSKADTATEISRAQNFGGDRHFVAKFLETSPLKSKVFAEIPEGSVLAGPDPRMPERQGGAIRLRAPNGEIWEVDTGDAHKGDSSWKAIGNYRDGFVVRKTGEVENPIKSPIIPPAPSGGETSSEAGKELSTAATETQPASKLRATPHKDEADPKDWGEKPTAFFRIQDDRSPLPDQSRNYWSGADTTHMEGVSAFGEVLQASRDLLSGKYVDESNYTEDVKSEGGKPVLSVFAGTDAGDESGNAQGWSVRAEPDTEVRFTPDQLTEAWRKVVAKYNPGEKADIQKMDFSELDDTYELSDLDVDVYHELRNMANATLKAAKARQSTSPPLLQPESGGSEAPRAATPELQKYADQAAAVRQKISPDLTKVEQSALVRKATRLEAKARGEELRHAGADPSELVDDLIIRGGELIRQGKSAFDEWSRKMREEFGKDADPHLRGVWRDLKGPQEETSTAAKKAKVDEERAARSAEELPWSPKTRSDEDLLASAKKANELKPNEARQLTSEVLLKPRALSDRETVQIDLHKQALVNDHNKLLGEVADTTSPEDLASKSVRLDAIEQEWDDTDRAWRLSGTEKGRSLRAQQITINQNYELLPMKARMKAATGETKLPPEVEAKIEAQQKRIADLEDRWNKRSAGKDEKARTDSVDKFVIEKKIAIRRAGRRRAHEDLVTERASIKQQVAQAWAKIKPKASTLSMGGLGDIDPEGDLSRALGSLARNYIEDGVIKAADLVDVVHEHIKDVADLTKRQVSDLISGYGKIRESTVDPVEKKFNEIKSILASTSGKADVVEKGVRPLRRGQQREKPTEDQRRALRELEDAMREKGPELAKRPYDAKTEQASPLDKAKTTARNRQEQLKKWIADGKREVQGRQQIIPDAELKQLKAENASLERVVALLDDPAADLKAIERRTAELQRIISKQRSSIQTGNVFPGVKEGAKSLWSPEISAMERERRALTSIANDMRSDAVRKAKAAEASKPTGIYGVEGSWADFEARARKALTARKRFEKQIADYQQRRQVGDFEKKPKAEQQVYDADTENLRLEMNREKRKFDTDVFNAKIKKEWSERPLWSKGLAYGAAGVRAGVLSGVKTIGKIGSALAQRTGQQYLEEGAARGLKRFAPGTAEKATRYGGHMNVESESAAAKGFGAGVKEIPHIIRTGESELSQRFNDRYPGIPTKLGRALEVPGRFHFAEKNPLLRAEFARSRELLLQQAERLSPGSRSNPTVIDAAETQAYKNAKEVILMGDNPFSRRFTDAQRRMGLESKDLVRTIVPVHRVAGNYLNQMISEYGMGLFRGAVRAIRERNPDVLEKLTPEEAEKTMRLLQRGSLGAVYMAVAASGIGGVTFGGFYKRGRKDEVKPQDVKVGRVTIPHWALHSPPDELAQLAASMKQEWQEGKAKDKTASQRLWSGVARSGKGIADQTPFVNELTKVTDSLENGDSLADWAGRFVASRVEPQIVQEVAKSTDKYEAQDIKRKPKGFTDALKMGLPGARQTVSISPVFGSKATKASSEIQRLDVTLEGVKKKPDETPKEFAERQPLVNGYTRRALEREVANTGYQRDSDENKVERLKQVKAAAEKEGQAAYDAIPRAPKYNKKQKQTFTVPSGKPQASLRSPWLPPRNPFKTGSEAFKA